MIKAALLASTLWAPSAVAQGFDWDPINDTAVTVVTNASWLSVYLLEDRFSQETAQDAFSTNSDGLNPLDKPFAGQWDTAPAQVSDVILYGALAGGGAISAWALPDTHGYTPLKIYAQAVGINGVITYALKHGISRARPYTYATDPDADMVEAMQHIDSRLSFPSGHTSLTAVCSFSIAALLSSPAQENYWLYGGAAALTATMGGLRVAAGKHFPTDVIAGGLIGAAVGTATVFTHRKADQDNAAARFWSSPPSPMTGPMLWGFTHNW